MVRMMKEGKFSKDCAIKVRPLLCVAACACTAYWTPLQTLDHAVANHAANCAHLIEAGGLKYLFPAFMGKVRGRLWLCARVRARVPWACPHGCRAGDQGSKKTAKMHGQSEVAAVEEHSVAIVASMFSLLPEDGVPRCVGGCSSGSVAVCEPPAEHAHRFRAGSVFSGNSCPGTWRRRIVPWSCS